MKNNAYLPMLPTPGCSAPSGRLPPVPPVPPTEFLPNAAGEDVVAGIRTPQPLEEMAQKWPEVYAELYAYQDKLEKYYGDMQVRSLIPRPAFRRCPQMHAMERTCAPRAEHATRWSDEDRSDEAKLGVNEHSARHPFPPLPRLLPLPCAGHRVHGRERPALHAPVP